MGRLAGVEVPFFIADLIWLELSVPSDPQQQQQSITAGAAESSLSFAPSTTGDVAGFASFGNPPRYVVWRIHESVPNVIELVEFSACEDLPRVGLRVIFPSDVFSSVYICKEERGLNSKSGDCYQLYALTVSGLAYCLQLRNFSTYASCSIFPNGDLLILNLHNYQHHGEITTMSATMGLFLIGRSDGSVGCFRIGGYGQNAHGSVLELRDDAGIGRLWGLISRNRMIGAVQDMVILEIQSRKFVFLLHLDGTLRVWDIEGCNRVLSHVFSTGMLAGSAFLKLWVGEPNAEGSLFPLAILCRSNDEIVSETLIVQGLHFSLSDKISISVDAIFLSIPLEEAKLIDLKFMSNMMWVLKDDGLSSHNLFRVNPEMVEALAYSLQDSFVADQLFQNAEHVSDDLLSICLSILSSNEQIAKYLSSVFIRRLLQPGVYDIDVMRRTLHDYNKHMSISEVQSLNSDGVEKEILSVIERETLHRSPLSVFYCWKAFCALYFDYWCKNSVPYGLLAESSSGAIGLIRKRTISLIRGLETIEMLIDGSFDEVDSMSSGLLPRNKDEREVLMEVLQCVNRVSQQFGKAASVVMYETCLNPLTAGSEDVVTSLLKILEIGYTSSVASIRMLEMGHDVALEKQMLDHKTVRKFSVDMLLSLRALYNKATRWTAVLHAIESYLTFLVPKRMELNENYDGNTISQMQTSVSVQATSQIAKLMFESSSNVLLFLGYLLKTSGQLHMTDEEISRIQLYHLPMVQEIMREWLTVQFLATTSTQGPAVDDFSSQLSSLNIDGDIDHKSWSDRLGKCDFNLAHILLANIQKASAGKRYCLLQSLPDSQCCITLIKNFTSWVVWGTGCKELSAEFFIQSIHVAIVLLRHRQYNAVENLLTIVHANLQKERICKSIQDNGGEWCVVLHLLGCCLLAQASESHGNQRERKVSEAVRCLFRAAASQEAQKALQSLSGETGVHFSMAGSPSYAAWKLQYYQWAMQIFEQYNISTGASQFARAALEQVDEALEKEDDYMEGESSTMIKGRLWANIFKFTLDLNQYFDAYCAIITNPDPESKHICLRRFLIVLYERGSVKILCDGQLPFVGLTEKVEQELLWKAERSELSVKPNPYKLLYAFEMHRHNWRRAATYIYKYYNRLKCEVSPKDHQSRSLALLERLNALSVAINALYLVDPAYAWVDSLPEESAHFSELLPSKRARIHVDKNTETADQTRKLNGVTDIEKLEKDYVLTSAEYLLSLSNSSWTPTGHDRLPSDLVDLLVQTNLYDMAFTVLMKFWKDISLKRELERVFRGMATKCCPVEILSSEVRDGDRAHNLLWTPSNEDMVFGRSLDAAFPSQNTDRSSHWDTLKIYIEKYICYNARLPVIVAQTILHADPQIELPVWLVHMFKVDVKEKRWGMAGQESCPAMLFQIYVDCGRYTEATNLLVEYLESCRTLKPNDIIHRKKTSAIWFPYTVIEQLCAQLDQMIKLGRMVDHCDKLKSRIYTAVRKHLEMVKVDSEDVIASSLIQNTVADGYAASKSDGVVNHQREKIVL